MAGYRYSLANVKIGISAPGMDKPKEFGGQGSMIGSITLSRKNDRFSAEGDATGGFVINESLDKTGTCVISIKQFAPLVSTLTNLFNNYDVYYGNSVSAVPAGEEELANINLVTSGEDVDNDAISITVSYAGRVIGRCEGCYLNMPELPLEEENGTRDFTFECGEVNFEMLDATQASKIGITKI